MELDKAEIIALFVESLLYGTALLYSNHDNDTHNKCGIGISCAISVKSLWFLIFDRNGHAVITDVKHVFAGTVVLLWLLSTVHLGINLERMIEAFCNYESGHSPTEYFLAVNDMKHIVKSALFITQTCVSDIAIV